VPRSGEEARRRLQKAAFELYLERGYDQTTATEIAARAGVTERTFFRHFPDKREVLFDKAAVLSDALIGALAEAPAALTPFEALLRAFRSAEQFLRDNRPFIAPRQKVIANTPALQERELAKTAALIAALAEVLKRRGVEGRLATLAAQVGMAAFSHAAASWLDEGSDGLDAHLDRAFDQLRLLSCKYQGTDQDGHWPL
jgi:AcrR family transcriptional regulator